ncbi:hypothetical protein [Alloactinosynnema sp. L-07]|uniref:hypothetical protein n=1 Tax=Alloactinosynnema sp. L-07 TaxID=1653480 RepID=UPI00065F0779|nr:hypothetical protein [Alloactinosynnema sp. L-07]CRK58805.1 hypothetical protein [Alloactinosynnema sp. L-07]
MTARPLEVRVAAGIVAVGAALFLVLGIVRGEPRAPIIFTILAALAIAAMVSGWGKGRAIASCVVVFLALSHALIALGGLPWEVRTVSGAVAAGYVYAVILLLTGPARAHFGGARRG